ncbi:hypothetical protein BH11PSE8_BH11PSE8_27900 [soil metagenome]
MQQHLTTRAVTWQFSRRMGSAAALCAACLSTPAFAANGGLDDAILALPHQWAQVAYALPAPQQDEGYRGLLGAAEQASIANPGRAEPLVWQAIALSGAAQAEGGLAGLAKAKRARDLLLQAEKLDANALSGSIYGTLGSLYAKVPGWPIGFGDKTRAKAYFERALAINPQGIDPNYFYADFLADQGHYAEAVEHLERALAAPARPGRADSDAGRRREAQALLDSLRQQHGDQLVARRGGRP